MQGVSDITSTLAARGRTVAVNISSSGDNTVHTVTSGTRFVVYQLWLQAEATVEVTIKSGASTSISGQIEFATDAEKGWGEGSVKPVFIGRAIGDNFIINLGAAIQVNGFAVVVESAS